MLSTHSLGRSANILGPNQGIYIYLYSPQVSPQKTKKIGFLLSWLNLDEEEILVKGLVHWTKWKLCLLHQCNASADIPNM